MQRCSSQVYFGKAPPFFVPANRCHLFLWHLHCHVSFLQLLLLDLHFPCWCTDPAEAKLFQGWGQFSAHFTLRGNLLGSTHPVLRKTALGRPRPRGLNWRGCRNGYCVDEGGWNLWPSWSSEQQDRRWAGLREVSAHPGSCGAEIMNRHYATVSSARKQYPFLRKLW